MNERSNSRKRVLAVASAGGHWIQLLRIRPAFYGHEIRFISTSADSSGDVEQPLYVVTDANMWEKVRLALMFIEVSWHVIKFRPDVVISTGAAPGFAAILIGRIIGSKTIWIDSIANSQELSRSGKHARRFATIWLTQWSHLTSEDGPEYWGSVL